MASLPRSRSWERRWRFGQSKMMPYCTHKRIRSIVLVLEPNHEQSLRCAVATLQCHLCGQPFKFAGILEAQK
jgi:hypothetical protein